MVTIDLTTPPPPPTSFIDAMARRLALTLPELRLVAELAGGAPLPFDLAAAGLPGCAILVSPDVCVPAVTQAAAPAPGRATIALAMPQSPALLGLRFFAQWYAGGPSPAFTRALRFELLQPAP